VHQRQEGEGDQAKLGQCGGLGGRHQARVGDARAPRRQRHL
jgi:hypothetical protein